MKWICDDREVSEPSSEATTINATGPASWGQERSAFTRAPLLRKVGNPQQRLPDRAGIPEAGRCRGREAPANEQTETDPGSAPRERAPSPPASVTVFHVLACC